MIIQEILIFFFNFEISFSISFYHFWKLTFITISNILHIFHHFSHHILPNITCRHQRKLFLVIITALIHIHDYSDYSPLISIVAGSQAKKSQCPSLNFFIRISVIAPKVSFIPLYMCFKWLWTIIYMTVFKKLSQDWNRSRHSLLVTKGSLFQGVWMWPDQRKSLCGNAFNQCLVSQIEVKCEMVQILENN